MSASAEPPPVRGEHLYLLIGFGALVLVLLLTAAREASFAGLMATMFGAAGLLFRWRFAPSFLLLTMLALLLLAPFYGPTQLQPFDPLLAAAVLTYLLAQYRLFHLEDAPLSVARREPGTSEPFVALLVPIGALAAAGVVYALLPARPNDLQIYLDLLAAPLKGFARADTQWPEIRQVIRLDPAAWQMLVLFWLGAVVWFVGGGLLRQLLWRQASAAEAGVYLQDVGWRETRREEERIYVWHERGRTWGRKRR